MGLARPRLRDRRRRDRDRVARADVVEHIAGEVDGARPSTDCVNAWPLSVKVSAKLLPMKFWIPVKPPPRPVAVPGLVVALIVTPRSVAAVVERLEPPRGDTPAQRGRAGQVWKVSLPAPPIRFWTLLNAALVLTLPALLPVTAKVLPVPGPVSWLVPAPPSSVTATAAPRQGERVVAAVAADERRAARQGAVDGERIPQRVRAVQRDAAAEGPADCPVSDGLILRAVPAKPVICSVRPTAVSTTLLFGVTVWP